MVACRAFFFEIVIVVCVPLLSSLLSHRVIGLRALMWWYLVLSSPTCTHVAATALPSVPFGSLVEYHPITAKDQSRIHQFGKKALPGLFLGYALYAGRIWKGDVLVADLEELETMDGSEIYSKRLNAKEVIFHKQGEFIFLIADGRIKPLEEIRT